MTVKAPSVVRNNDDLINAVDECAYGIDKMLSEYPEDWRTIYRSAAHDSQFNYQLNRTARTSRKSSWKSVARSVLYIFLAMACHLLIMLPLRVLQPPPGAPRNVHKEQMAIQFLRAGPLLTGFGLAGQLYYAISRTSNTQSIALSPRVRWFITLTWALKGLGYLVGFMGLTISAFALGFVEVSFVGIFLLVIISCFWIQGVIVVYKRSGPVSLYPYVTEATFAE
ncbi:hypothetical protein SISNIDRAFT_455413 [Sistotremastrum niveocremeum HHB9708]|uniref:Uncharacterized protein n=1 Tax=Sistotremastrum niveocremeum HHB9708 TaxID=1314777 RepID=A0A164TZT3_9AGAM|nr:hypothetical protein SISNIDRAFT_455413 [Sistotremastrum niveocremeum HHB9708]